jgi:hypothetical protein
MDALRAVVRVNKVMVRARMVRMVLEVPLEEGAGATLPGEVALLVGGELRHGVGDLRERIERCGIHVLRMRLVQLALRALPGVHPCCVIARPIGSRRVRIGEERLDGGPVVPFALRRRANRPRPLDSPLAALEAGLARRVPERLEARHGDAPVRHRTLRIRCRCGLEMGPGVEMGPGLLVHHVVQLRHAGLEMRLRYARQLELRCVHAGWGGAASAPLAATAVTQSICRIFNGFACEMGATACQQRVVAEPTFAR